MRARPALLACIAAVLLTAACRDSGTPKAAASSAFDPFVGAAPAAASVAPVASVSALTIGQCFDTDDFAPGSTIDARAVHLVDCASPHQHEVYAVVAGPATGSFPGTSALSEFADDHCLSAFTTTLGREYQGSRFDFAAITPDATQWDGGDRLVVCALYDSGFDVLTGSVLATTTTDAPAGSLASKDS